MVAYYYGIEKYCGLDGEKRVGIVLRTPSNLFSEFLFFIPKKSDKFRPIHNLKKIHRFVLYRHFKMEGNSILKLLVNQGIGLQKLI